MQPTAQSLILDLLSTMGAHAMPVRALVEAAALFGIRENNLRVALARLLARGLVARNERGQYRLAEGAQPVTTHVTSWTRIGERMTPWQGAWVGVSATAVSRRSRATVRRHKRALDFLGLRELDPHLWVRPNNLSGGVAEVRRQLYDLGFERSALVFAMGDLAEEADRRAYALWDTDALQASYREMRAAIERSATFLPTLTREEAMVESFLIGGEALRRIALDPLLPEQILPPEDRLAFIEAMRTYDRLGRDCWRDFMLAQGVTGAASPLRYRVIDAAAVRPAMAAARG